MSDNEADDMVDMTTVDKTTTPLYQSAPRAIGLAIGDEAEDWMSEFHDCDEVTWFSGGEPVDVCVHYIRSDIYDESERRLKEALRLHDELVEALRKIGSYPNAPQTDAGPTG
jgi:hypothetical protein